MSLSADSNPFARSHVDFDDAAYVESLPFRPFDATLQEVLRRRYISPVAAWLLGRNETALLAMEGNSAWETALTIRFLIDASDIFSAANESVELRKKIDGKVVAATRWLLEKRISHANGTYCWEHVTWDTSVITEALIEVIDRYRPRFSPDEQIELDTTICGASVWLHHQFAQWETRVKYPFGPADVAQIANTLLVLEDKLPDANARVKDVLPPAIACDLPLEVVQYLLHRRTFKRFAITDDGGTVESQSCWWDDYFSTAEVIEALARFHRAASRSDDPARKDALDAVRNCLIEACAFLENTQLDGMWGNHIDTVRILSAYIMTRRLLPQDAEGRVEPILLPELHITFKAVRWICDEKQIFDDGSFLHALFLTVFYAMSLVEVYRSWEPAKNAIDRLYDDVVWATPVRTTPERTRRLAADLMNASLSKRLDELAARRNQLSEALFDARQAQRKIRLSVFVAIAVLLIGLIFALTEHIIKIRLGISDRSNFINLLVLLVPGIAIIVGAIWKFPQRSSWKDSEDD